MKNDETVILSQEELKKEKIKMTLCDVANSLISRGYNPVAQLAGYVVSGDPAYITGYNNARKKIMQYSSLEVAEFLVEEYLRGE